tara:strand:+ start:972 stop:1952 length:981 start_codon:yes stop_codon:yes gene_type:complete
MILYCCNDSGPANYISHIILNTTIDYVCICSDISENQFKNNGITVFKKDTSIDYSKIKLIVTGTCLGDGIDKYFITKGKDIGIKTISIIEHWSLYKERFRLNENYIYPDYIFVNDEIAFREALESNVPQNKLIIAGNPYLNNLSKSKLVPAKNYLWKNNNNLKSNIIITFISESFKEDFAENNQQGFDEYEVINMIMKLGRKMKFQLLIRKHPSEPNEKYNELISENIKIDQNSSFDSIVHNSSYIIGMGSMFLIEASMFRSDIISLRPNEKVEFIGNKTGITNKITNVSELDGFIKNNSVKKFDNKCKNFYLDKTPEIINKLYFN